MKPLLILAFLLIAPTVNAETTVIIESDDSPTQLIELYTSEGCSSCPPADKWLSQMKTHPQLWKHFVPLAFHVDYWNYLGWKDPFSKAEYSDRQRQHRLVGNSRAVYTPGFMIQGREWRGWFKGNAIAAGKPLKGKLIARVTGNNVQLAYSEKKQDLYFHLALLGFDLENQVKAGENHGQRLQHDFVVLDHQQIKARQGKAQAMLGKTSFPDVKRFALALWIENAYSKRPLQVVGGWLK